MPWPKNFLPDCLRASILALALAVRAEDSPELQHAIKPLADGVPEVAAIRLRELLRGNLPAGEKAAATLKLAEACIATQQPAEALRLLASAGLRGNPAADFQRAQSFAALHRWSEALPVYQAVAAANDLTRKAEATLGAAESLRALGRKDEAAKVLPELFAQSDLGTRARLQAAELALEKKDVARAKQLLRELKPTGRSEESGRQFLAGRIELAEDRNESAVETFAAILHEPEGVAHSVLIGALFATADAQLQLKMPEAGDDYLEEFLDQHPADADVPALFAKLEQLYRAERKPSLNELSHWMHDDAQPRRAFAQWYFARSELRGGHRDLAEQDLTALRDSGYKHPALTGALLELAQLSLEDGQPAAALETLAAARTQNPAPELLDRVTLLTAEAHTRGQDFAAAAPLFAQVAQSNPELAPTALYNDALTSLRLGKIDQFQANYKLLSERFPESELRQQLILEQGLVQASQGDKIAAQSLHQFLHDFPQSPRVAEAWVAVAEMAFHATPPDLTGARENLDRALKAQPNEAALEHADYLAIWLDDAPLAGRDSQVIALASDFLKKHPDSTFVPDVRMKLAEAYFRRQDFPNAQTQFEVLAHENPGSPWTEKALFFAGESAVASMGNEALDRAISLFEEVVRLNGEWKWPARNGEAAAERKLGKETDALVLYDEVLKSDAKPEVKAEALCGKGDAFYALATADSANYRRAIESFDQLAATPSVTPHWRNQALFKKAKCLESLNDKTGALATCYQVIEPPVRPDKPREHFWFYRAGFDAARLLEGDSNWSSAVAVYRKLASVGGPRSDEAKARITRLRLEHFLWEE